MAKLPIEIVRIGKLFHQDVAETISLLNLSQKEIEFSLLPDIDEEKFQLLDFRAAEALELLDKIKKIQNELKGYHPYLIVVTNIEFTGNLFGEARPEEGLAVFTFRNIPNIIIPTPKIKAYISYFIARYTFNFLIPSHRNHDTTRGCVFDMKRNKLDLLKSMGAKAICDDCRTTVIDPRYNISAPQFTSLNLIFGKAGELLEEDVQTVVAKANKPKIFIGSSTEGLDVARGIQSELHGDYEVVIWNQGPFQRLTLSFLETLEEIVNAFDYGVFVFTPDDKIDSRGESKTIARDNVIFELGMFTGKLGRRKTFLVHPINTDIHILSDFAGIIKATYDPKATYLQASLGPVCEQIRTTIKQIT